MNHDIAVKKITPILWDVKCSCGWRNVEGTPSGRQTAEDIGVAHQMKAKYAQLNTGVRASSLKKTMEYYEECAASPKYSEAERQQWRNLADGLACRVNSDHQQDTLF